MRGTPHIARSCYHPTVASRKHADRRMIHWGTYEPSLNLWTVHTAKRKAVVTAPMESLFHPLFAEYKFTRIFFVHS